MADIILKEKIRNPIHDPQDEGGIKWFNPFYITDDNKIHINGQLESIDSVDSKNIKKGAITGSIVDENEEIQQGELAFETITNRELAKGTINGSIINENEQIQQGQIAFKTITSRELADGAIPENSGIISQGAITQQMLAQGSISSNRLFDSNLKDIIPYQNITKWGMIERQINSNTDHKITFFNNFIVQES